MTRPSLLLQIATLNIKTALMSRVTPSILSLLFQPLFVHWAFGGGSHGSNPPQPTTQCAKECEFIGHNINNWSNSPVAGYFENCNWSPAPVAFDANSVAKNWNHTTIKTCIDWAILKTRCGRVRVTASYKKVEVSYKGARNPREIVLDQAVIAGLII